MNEEKHERPEDISNQLIDMQIVKRERGVYKQCRCTKPRYILNNDLHKVYCATCQCEMNPYDALVKLADNQERMLAYYQRLYEGVDAIDNYKPFLRKIKKVESYYMGKNETIPICPHCGGGITLDDLAECTCFVNKELDARRRKAKPSERQE